MAASFNFLSTIIAIPFIGLLFALAAKDDEKTHGRNVFNVSVFAIMTNLLVIWRMFALLDVSAPGLQKPSLSGSTQRLTSLSSARSRCFL